MTAPSSGAALAAAVLAVSAVAAEPDPHLWLEEIESERALEWVRAHNDSTLAELESDPLFETLYAEAEAILNAKDRIPDGTYQGDRFYDFWQDEEHVRGLWRRTTLESFRTEEPDWEVLLDVDALDEAEGENWVYKGSVLLPPDFDRALVTLSRGGKDASVIREFDLRTKEFVEDGFFLPEARSEAAWWSRDTLVVATDFGEGSLSASGYPRLVKLWKRGTPLEQAVTIHESDPTQVGAEGVVSHREDGFVAMVMVYETYFDYELHVWDGGGLRRLPVPASARPSGVFAGRLLLRLSEDWERPGAATIPAGTLVALSVGEFLERGELPQVEILFEPDERTTVDEVAVSRSAVWVSTLHNVRGELHRLTPRPDGGWSAERVDLPPNGSVRISSADAFSDVVMVSYRSFLVPTRLLEVDSASLETRPLKALPERFDATGCTVEQFEATSTDGERIPYFLVRRAHAAKDGATPTLLYGYGGFEISQTPRYIESFGKLWLERGGAYAIANIRGGGEFGPRWHRAALREKRQVSFDDFHAIAQDLIARRVTNRNRLGIMGGSQGGLLVGVALTQRPDLYAATVCQVPLLDMLRYHLLPPGASWMAEYGDPDDPEMHPALAAYSPYHNLREGTTYRNVFLVTSTKDDRVHPGHARKMAARLEELGQEVRYFENIEGGHAAGANRNQRARRVALEFTHLARSLGLATPR